MESMSKEIDAVIVPVGGAGFIAGISVVIKHLLPEVQVIVSQNYFYGFMGYLIVSHTCVVYVINEV